MRSSRLAIAAVTAGSALLGWSTVGVTAIAGNLPDAASPVQQQLRPQVRDRDHGFDDLDLDVPRPRHGSGHRGV
jgi:hypothetical protein